MNNKIKALALVSTLLIGLTSIASAQTDDTLSYGFEDDDYRDKWNSTRKDMDDFLYKVECDDSGYFKQISGDCYAELREKGTPSEPDNLESTTYYMYPDWDSPKSPENISWKMARDGSSNQFTYDRVKINALNENNETVFDIYIRGYENGFDIQGTFGDLGSFGQYQNNGWAEFNIQNIDYENNVIEYANITELENDGGDDLVQGNQEVNTVDFENPSDSIARWEYGIQSYSNLYYGLDDVSFEGVYVDDGDGVNYSDDNQVIDANESTGVTEDGEAYYLNVNVPVPKAFDVKGLPIGTIFIVNAALILIGFIVGLIPEGLKTGLEDFLGLLGDGLGIITGVINYTLGVIQWLTTIGIENIKTILKYAAMFVGLHYASMLAEGFTDGGRSPEEAITYVVNDAMEQIGRIESMAYRSFSLLMGVAQMFVIAQNSLVNLYHTIKEHIPSIHGYGN